MNLYYVSLSGLLTYSTPVDGAGSTRARTELESVSSSSVEYNKSITAEPIVESRKLFNTLYLERWLVGLRLFSRRVNINSQ